MDQKRPLIVLFRQDLRLQDNPALWNACQRGLPIICIYVLDDETPGEWKIGAAQRWWLHHSLNNLRSALKELNAQLVLRQGRTDEVLAKLIKETEAQGIYFNRCYEPFWIGMQETLKKLAPVHSFNSALLIEPWEIQSLQGTPFKVFTPFWKAASKDLSPSSPLPIPRIIPHKPLPSESLEEWNLLPSHPNWAGGFSSCWTPGEKGARVKLGEFRHKIADYAHDRDFPSKPGTSMLSPHLHFGEISPRQVYHEIIGLKDHEPYLREIGWREFAHHLLYHFPNLPQKPFQNKFDRFPWKEDPSSLKAWQKGKTGFPIIDAGMRQLWSIGWMHNRLRMIVGSFLTKNLLIPWQEGQRWFWDTLVDASLANNSFGWQWIAGCGADAAPFFRIFNPVLQSEKFDPDGAYIKKWVPELADLPADYIHDPAKAPPLVLRSAGVTPGREYPHPIADLQTTRDRALDYFERIK